MTFKVIKGLCFWNFGTNRNRVCNFLLVINSNRGPPILPFQSHRGFSAENSDITPIPPESSCVSLGLSRWSNATYRPSTTMVHQRHGRTGRRTDGQTTYDSNTALHTTCTARKHVAWSCCLL